MICLERHVAPHAINAGDAGQWRQEKCYDVEHVELLVFDLINLIALLDLAN